MRAFLIALVATAGLGLAAYLLNLASRRFPRRMPVIVGVLGFLYLVAMAGLWVSGTLATRLLSVQEDEDAWCPGPPRSGC